MDTFHNILMKHVENLFNEDPNKAQDLDIEKLIATLTPMFADHLKKSLNDSTNEMLIKQRSLSDEFITHNISRWSEAFNLLEKFIVICTDSGVEINNSYRTIAYSENDLVFDLVIRHHARACHISNEILCLLKNGFADAAHARWRALHEVAATTMFIAKHGKECAERFYDHEIVESYRAMVEFKQYEHLLQAEGPSDEELAECKMHFDILIEKYGKMFNSNYGWISHIFPNNKKLGFGAIEKDVHLDHLRPYYKWASQNVHAGSKAIRRRLGLSETDQDLLLVGQSDAGMTDPAHATAISLMQTTATLLFLKPNIDHIVLANILKDYSDEIGEVFLKIQKNK